jgi:O-antigen ligase
MAWNYIKILNNKLRSPGAGTYFFALSTMILIPVYHWFLPPFMILWCVALMFELRTRKWKILNINPQHKILFVLFVLFYCWQILGMLYSDNPKEGWRNIELRISLLIFPLLLISPGDMIRQKCNILLRIFALSTFAYLVICYGYAFYRAIDFQNGAITFNPNLPVYTWLNYFYGLEFAIFQHTSYLSMFVLLSVFIALESFFDSSISRYHRYFWLFVSIILLVSIYFLSSRAGMLSAIILVPFYLFRKFIMLGKKKYLGLSLFIVAIILLTISLTNPRVNNYLKWRSGKELGDINIKDDRFTIWNSVNNILENNILFGVGTGDIQEALNNEYLKTGNTRLAEANTNAHNQYIEIILENGLIGLIIFLSLFGMMFYIAITEKNILFLMFILIVLFSFLFETMLNRLAGVSFFSIFSFLLIYINNNQLSMKTTLQKKED